MDEFDIIGRFFVRDKRHDGVVLGIGDDGAELRPDSDRNLVTVVDTLVSGVHFPRLLPADDVGFRAVAVNLSDIAAMGARPRWMTLALTLPNVDAKWIKGFARGLFSAADQHDVALVGGDTTAGTETVVTIQIIGDVEAGRSLTRSGASAGDDIYVTGTIGDAAAGLAVFTKGGTRDSDAEFLLQRFCRPASRVRFGEAIASQATAAIDVSDGLCTDLEKLLAASELAATIDVDAIPMSNSLTATVQRSEARATALSGGDDYELCFTSSKPATEIQSIAKGCGVDVARIGAVHTGSGLRCERDGREFVFADGGYRHFA